MITTSSQPELSAPLSKYVRMSNRGATNGNIHVGFCSFEQSFLQQDACISLAYVLD